MRNFRNLSHLGGETERNRHNDPAGRLPRSERAFRASPRMPKTAALSFTTVATAVQLPLCCSYNLLVPVDGGVSFPIFFQ